MKDKKKQKKKVKNAYVSRHGRKTKIVKIKYGRIFLFLIILGLVIYATVTYVQVPIKNIFVSGNSYLSDQEIIDLAGISNYPSVLNFTNNQLEKRLEKNIYIEDATIRKDFRKIYIEIKENYPLFYNQITKKTIMHNYKETKDILNAPILVNSIIDKTYNLFKTKMKLIDRDIIDRISEIKYDPNSVDEERFLFTMSDGNYVYITLEKIESINNYVDIIKTFDNKKGILYLDSGEYFEVFKDR